MSSALSWAVGQSTKGKQERETRSEQRRAAARAGEEASKRVEVPDSRLRPCILEAKAQVGLAHCRQHCRVHIARHLLPARVRPWRRRWPPRLRAAILLQRILPAAALAATPREREVVAAPPAPRPLRHDVFIGLQRGSGDERRGVGNCRASGGDSAITCTLPPAEHSTLQQHSPQLQRVCCQCVPGWPLCSGCDALGACTPPASLGRVAGPAAVCA